MSDTHDLALNSHFVTGAEWASCSCGWIGEEWEDRDDAILDWENHRDEADHTEGET